MTRTLLPTIATLWIGTAAAVAAPTPAAAAEPTRPAPAASPAPSSPAAESGPLSVERAIELALELNETPAIAAARLERAQALRRQAVAALLPSLSLTGTYTRRAREVTREISGDTVTVQAIDALNGQAAVESTLFDLRALPLLRAATAGADAQARESAELRRALAFDVAAGFLDAVAAEALAGAANERVRVAEATLRQTRIRRDAGLADRNDVTRTELEEATAKGIATQAASLVTTARLALAYLVGAPVEQRPLLVPDETRLPEGDEAALLARAEANRDDLAALALRARQAQQMTLVPRYGILPRLDLRAIYRATNEAGLSGREEDWNASINFTWELWDGGDRYALADQRDAEAREAELTLAAARRGAALDVRRALAELDSAAAAVAQAEVRQRVARANAEEVDERFRNGLATALEVADALASRFEADAGGVLQRAARSAARLALLDALGDWPLPRPAAAPASQPTASESSR